MIVDRKRFGDSEIKSCKQCGRRLHPEYNKDICPACMEMNLFNEVKDYILERIEHEDLTIDAIASHLRMSRTKFYNRWKTLTGEAPTVFIEAIRMEKAHELLESGKYPVGTIPEMIGLKDVKNFRNRYKEYFGITPKESIKKK